MVLYEDDLKLIFPKKNIKALLQSKFHNNELLPVDFDEKNKTIIFDWTANDVLDIFSSLDKAYAIKLSPS